MKIADPYRIKISPLSSVIYTSLQDKGEKSVLEDYAGNYQDQCFVIADAVSGYPHGDVVSRLCGETALWGYNHIRTRATYWADKRKLLKRIFRSCNIAMFQKKREIGFEKGAVSTLVIAIIGSYNAWIGSVGDSRAYLFKNDLLTTITCDDTDEHGYLTKALGTKRYGLVPQTFSIKYSKGSVLLLVTDGISRYITDDDIYSNLSSLNHDRESLKFHAKDIINLARKRGSMENKSVIIIKKDNS